MKQRPSIEELYCALLFLLSRYAHSPEPTLPAAIKDHLNWLANHPAADDLHTLRKTCGRLALYWESGNQGDADMNSAAPMRRDRSDLH